MKTKNNKKAFSLVELSIVIIILGLLVASVTVGKDLINAAQIRGLITQIQGIETQLSTFELKYDAFPGDISNASKRGLAIDPAATGDIVHNGDGDGIIEDENGGDPDLADGEVVFLWDHLSQAGFADGSYDGDGFSSDGGNLGTTFPKAKHGGGIVIYGESGKNYMHIGIGNSTGTAGAKEINFTDTFTPEDAFAVDTKIDDAFPLKGKVIARSASCSSNPNDYSCASTAITTTSGGASQTATDGTCVLQDGSSQDIDLDEYNFETTVVKCQLRYDL